MPMNKLTRHRMILILLTAAISCAVFAQDSQNRAPDPQKAERGSEVPPQPLLEKDDAAAENQDAEKTYPAGTSAADPLKEFNPTDKIQADSAVSFPVDI